MVSRKIEITLALIMKLKLWFYNHFKHINIQCGKNCNIKNLHLSSCGKNNSLIMEDGVVLKDVTIKVFGNNNVILIGKGNYFHNINFAIEDDNNKIKIGNNVYIGEKSLLAALEGTNITIGSDCMIAGPCELRTSDSHSLLDLNGNRLNTAKDINIGNHVWVGTECLILKGANIPSDCVIAAKSLVCKTNIKWMSFAVYGGNPAKLIKSNINWNKERI